MKVTSTETVQKITRSVRIDDGPIVQIVGYRRKFRVQIVRITYTWKQDRWVLDSSFDVHMAGPWVKKDGTNAVDRTSNMRPDCADWSTRKLAEQFAFLEPIINLARPHGAAAMMELRETEIVGD